MQKRFAYSSNVHKFRGDLYIYVNPALDDILTGERMRDGLPAGPAGL